VPSGWPEGPFIVAEVALNESGDVAVIAGQAHVMKTVEDLHEAGREDLVAVTGRGRGFIGVIDGSPPVGVETQADALTRHRLVRDIGYKL